MTFVYNQSLSLLLPRKFNTLSKIILIPLLFILLSLVASSTTVRATSSSSRVPMLEYDDGQIRVLNCMLGASSRESCDVRSYHKIMWLWATPTLCVALITFAFVIIYFPGKYWCHCCGGKYQTPNMCWPNYQLPAKYSKGELFRPVFLSVTCCLMCIAGCIWACTSASRVQNGLNQVMQHSELVVQYMHSALYEILLPCFQEIIHLRISNQRTITTTKESHVFSLEGTNNANSEALPVLAEVVQEIINMRNMSIVALHNFISQYIIAIYPICVIALLTSLFGMVAGVCNWRRYTSTAVMTLLCVLSVLTWLLTAHSVVSHFLITGACSEVFAFNQQRVNVLQAAMNCNESYLEVLSTTLDEIAQKYSTEIISNDSNNNSNRILSSEELENTENGRHNEEITRHAMPKWENNSNNAVTMHSSRVVQHHYHQQHVFVAEEKVSDDATKSLCAVQRLQHVMTTVKSRLTECETIINEFVSPLDLTCQQLVENAYNLCQGLGILALATTVGLFAYIYGAKRFIAFDQAYLPQYDIIVDE